MEVAMAGARRAVAPRPWVSHRLPRAAWLGCFALLAAALLSAYRQALDGPFLSDDFFLVVGLAGYPVDAGFVAAVFDPAGDLRFQVGNYAPLYLLASRAEWALFGQPTRGYHVVNVLLHALNATLLLSLFAPSPARWPPCWRCARRRSWLRSSSRRRCSSR
jgi:hypothetical protein